MGDGVGLGVGVGLLEEVVGVGVDVWVGVGVSAPAGNVGVAVAGRDGGVKVNGVLFPEVFVFWPRTDPEEVFFEELRGRKKSVRKLKVPLGFSLSFVTAIPKTVGEAKLEFLGPSATE